MIERKRNKGRRKGKERKGRRRNNIREGIRNKKRNNWKAFVRSGIEEREREREIKEMKFWEGGPCKNGGSGGGGGKGEIKRTKVWKVRC